VRLKLVNDAVLLRYEGLSELGISTRLSVPQCTIHRYLVNNAVPNLFTITNLFPSTQSI
jgi:hypothetical protein